MDQLRWNLKLDLTGKLISSSLSTGAAAITIPDLAEGIYTLKLTTDEGVIFKKIVVQ